MDLHFIHSQLTDFETRTGLRVISAELELLLQLYAHGRLTSNQLMQKVRCSIAGFAIVKKRLFEAGMIVSERCTIDRRVTYFDISENIRETLQALDLKQPVVSGEKSIFSNFSEATDLSVDNYSISA